MLKLSTFYDVKRCYSALKALVAAEDRFVRESGIRLADPVADAVEDGRAAIAGASALFEHSPSLLPTKEPKPRIAIVMEGGNIQAVVANRPEEVGFDVMLIDYDTGGADPESIKMVKQDDGKLAGALVSVIAIEPAGVDLNIKLGDA